MARTRKFGWIGAAAVAALLGYAWINGGEQALRPIEQTVALPEGWQ